MIHAKAAASFDPAPQARRARARGPVAYARLAAEPELARAWERLESAATLPTQCLLFTAALSSTLLAGTTIELFTAPGIADIGALLPLCRAQGRLAPWRMVGAREVFEPGDALCESPEAARLLAEALARESRPIWFERMPASSPFVPAFSKAMKGKGFVSVRPTVPCPTIALDESWKEPESRFNSGRRSDFRRAARKAEAIGEVTYEVLSPGPEEFDVLFDEAVAVEHNSWKKEAGTAIAVDRPKEEFFRAFFREASRQGTMRIAFLRIGGQAAAMQLALEWQGRYWLFKIGYDEEYGKCSPGTLLMLHTLGWAAGRGLAAYELLGGVEPWIAEFWTRDCHPTVQLRAYPFSLAGGIALISETAGWLGRRLARAAR